MTDRSASGSQAIIATTVTLAASGMLAVPVVALAWIGLDQPWAAVAAPVVGLGIGLGSVALGTRLGGSHLDGHWPEVLKNVSEKHA